MKVKLIIILSFLCVIPLYFIFKEKDRTTSQILDFKSINGYNEEYLERYKLYQKKENIPIKDIVTRVNIGLDHPFYTNTKEVKETGYVTLINKYNRINKEYKPNDLVIPQLNNPNKLYLRKDASESYEKMVNDMQKENLNIYLESAYRSYPYQTYLYNKYKDKDGIEKADTYSARPGYSEHQLGLSFDLKTKEYSYEEFDKSDEFIWLTNNCYKYGFILRYPKDKESITGYNYEPWHYRYVGKTVSKSMKNKDITFDEYYYLYIKK